MSKKSQKGYFFDPSFSCVLLTYITIWASYPQIKIVGNNVQHGKPPFKIIPSSIGLLTIIRKSTTKKNILVVYNNFERFYSMGFNINSGALQAIIGAVGSSVAPRMTVQHG